MIATLMELCKAYPMSRNAIRPPAPDASTLEELKELPVWIYDTIVNRAPDNDPPKDMSLTVPPPRRRSR